MATIVYSDKYYCDIGFHVFPSKKYRLVYQMLEKHENLSDPRAHLIQPRVPTRDELLLVHTEKYLDDALNARLTPATFSSELPVKRDVIDAFLLSTGGTLVAAECATAQEPSINLGGGYHHAFADHAEGFCFFNDVAIATRKLLTEKKARRIAIVDCDLHQGNGTAHIFLKEENVFTFSIHQEDNYPVKQESDLDIGLDNGVGDQEYLEQLGRALDVIEKDFDPDFVFYLAGADPFEEDQLGALRLTHEGFRRRDDLVIGFSERKKIPICIVLAGGYSRDVRDTVRIHYQTCLRLFARGSKE
ncbi:MAG: histone deacetylase [Candidatus Abyssobacteria bacterium SURF_5]|uniref:Histone deacetylase n=1 Tax=Abyssobacteria bacterium (strain SURF_5) TaxID=2093360 RepID=A0A3A4NI10_ABYX5|nr:MAG: histone deacetylase [Candidatus Abyssubacteria bacterium SURF_5]